MFAILDIVTRTGYSRRAGVDMDRFQNALQQVAGQAKSQSANLSGDDKARYDNAYSQVIDAMNDITHRYSGMEAARWGLSVLHSHFMTAYTRSFDWLTVYGDAPTVYQATSLLSACIYKEVLQEYFMRLVKALDVVQPRGMQGWLYESRVPANSPILNTSK